MKFFGFVCVATSLIALNHVQASTDDVQELNTMQSGALCTGSNTDAALVPKQVYLNYPGVGEDKHDSTKTYFIRIMKEGQTDPIAKFDITDEEKIKKGGLFKLALSDATEGQYSMQSCHKEGNDVKCSPKSTPAKNMTVGTEATMDCARHDSTIDQITLKKIEGFYPKLDDLKKMPGSYASFHNFTDTKVYKKLGVEQTYSLYAAFEYDLTQFKQFYQSKVDYCKRKYHLTVLIHLVDQTTKEIKRQFKFSPKPLTAQGEAAYVLKDQAPKAPLEVLVKTADTKEIPKGTTYNLWSTVCVVEKDFGFDQSEKSVACAEPFVDTWAFN